MTNGKNKIIDLLLILVILFGVSLIVYSFIPQPEPVYRNRCGNDICEYRETVICPSDCPSGEEPICGDGKCTENEICSIDCVDEEIIEFCGDDICQNTESKKSCPEDCGFDLPECGNNECQTFTYPDGTKIDESLVCPQDCGIICGDGECVIDPYDERQDCPEDCEVNNICGDNICQDSETQLTCPEDCEIVFEDENEELIYMLNQKQRPLVAGLRTEHERELGFSQCTLGMIVTSGGKRYLLTAGHCVTKGEDGMPDPEDIGLWVKQGNEVIGTVYKIDHSGGVDATLISINNNVLSHSYEDYLGNIISGWGTVYEGLRVYKIGATTGYTTGTVTDTDIFYTDKNGDLIRGFEVTGDDGTFSSIGDSGAAILTLEIPSKIVGIISAGDGSNLPEDIRQRLDID